MEMIERLTVEYAGKLWHFELALLVADVHARRYTQFTLAYPFSPNAGGELLAHHTFTKSVVRDTVLTCARRLARAWLKDQSNHKLKKLATLYAGETIKGIVL